MPKNISISAVTVAFSADPQTRLFQSQVKQNIDVMTGQNSNSKPLSSLTKTATNEEIIASLNIIINRLGGA